MTPCRTTQAQGGWIANLVEAEMTQARGAQSISLGEAGLRAEAEEEEEGEENGGPSCVWVTGGGKPGPDVACSQCKASVAR